MDEVAAYALFNLCDKSRGFSVEQRLLARLRHRVVVQNESGRYPTKLASIVWHRFANGSWLAEHDISEEVLDKDVERLLLNSHVSAPVAKAVSTGTLRSYLAQLNGTPHPFPISQGLQHHALGILLNDIACIAGAATIAKMTIFLDDFYFVVRALPPTGREPLAARVRKVAIDGPFESARKDVFNWVAVMHTQTAHTFQGAWHNAGVDMHAPLKWDEPNSVVLRGFTPEQSSTLLREYLRYKPNRLAQPPSEIYPFTEEGLSALAIASQKKEASVADQSIVPRGLMESARFVLERALEAQIQAPIGDRFVEHVFSGTPFPLPVSEDDEGEEADTEQPQLSIACPCGCHDDIESDVFDVVAVISGSGNQRRATRHYCRNCNDAITLEGIEP